MAIDISLLAEWEPQAAILLALPHSSTDWCDVLKQAYNQYKRLVEALLRHNYNVILLKHEQEDISDWLKSLSCNQDRLFQVETVYNDTWVRDYGPISISKNNALRALDFGFNGWGLKFAADKDNLINLNLAAKNIISSALYRNNRDFELEGGSIETDGKGTLLTTSRCLCSPNRNGGKTKQELTNILQKRLGVSHILWLDYGALAGDDTDSHIDTLARMAPDDTILFVGCRDTQDEHFEELLKMRAQLTLFRNPEGKPYNLIELPLPDPIYDSNGMRLPATYANYLITDRHIFMPTYGQPEKDLLASQTIKIAFPHHQIVGVDCTTLILQHGSLHCATMQLYPGETFI
ncbi:MAG: agmatine deiminase family protein [Muribaculaceae bacterium]|nr:agmatine deiminase family protein [Muribaculaceae bacterium]